MGECSPGLILYVVEVDNGPEQMAFYRKLYRYPPRMLNPSLAVCTVAVDNILATNFSAKICDTKRIHNTNEMG